MNIKNFFILITLLSLPLVTQAESINAESNNTTSVKSGNEGIMEEIVLAGGCFWGIQDLFRKQVGVIETDVGYAGGDASQAKYEFVKTGSTGHAEALRVRFDTSKTNLENILKYFFKIHDPTTLDRQGNDIGTQYRSAIFYSDDRQKDIASYVIEKLEQENIWKKKIVTQLEKLESYTLAEDYHQDYLQKNPRGYTCHFERDMEF